MKRHLSPFLTGAALLALFLCPVSTHAITTVDGQDWSYEPDAWTRANSGDASHFGWDLLERTGATLGFTRILDDSSPDFSAGVITAASPRFYQVNTTNGFNGHVAGSFNYYSIFDKSDDNVSATAPASGSDGFTTVVLQVLGGAPGTMGANPIEDLSFEMLTAAWTHQKDFYGVEANGSGVYWQEWTAPGADLGFSINMKSATEHRSIDAIQIDTFWSPAGPIVNARTSIGVVPEPTAVLLASLALTAFAVRRRFA